MNAIQKSSVENEFFVPSAQSSNIYVVNSEIGTCTCPIGMTGAPCKHQGAVSVKFHISTFNFLPSLTSNDRMIYAYIALELKKYDNRNFITCQTQDQYGVRKPGKDLGVVMRKSKQYVDPVNITLKAGENFYLLSVK
ncbi:hypothetical protein RhiirA5_404881 [Rhizophagus irregularis]|uniref:SWIM-type domain-containing protein n=1 Tax=Rhizophagus irregularis TaxID=588596 RepID=A0A2N0NHX2_9GLOM|nr:hypothetical protein RhiirA5_404881 [Rhizophagus irregularis]